MKEKFAKFLQKARGLSLTKKVGIALAFFMLYLLLKNVIESRKKKNQPTSEYPFNSILLPDMQLRNDSLGFGHFGASRDGGVRSHNGVDILTYKGQMIFAPFDGKVTRSYQVYSSDTKYKGLEIIDHDGVYKMKIMYCNVHTDVLGYGVQKGDLIGFSQSISEKYGLFMKDHLHVELYKNNVRIDPQTHLYLK